MILLLNVSPKGENSNSYYFLNLLRERLTEECAYVEIKDIKEEIVLGVQMSEADAVVIGMPMYIDSVPAGMIRLMEELYQDFQGSFKRLPIYIMVNGGLYESRQAETLFRIMKNWCGRMDLLYGGGIAIGAGEMLSGLNQFPIWEKLNRHLMEGMDCLTRAVSHRQSMENYYTEAPTGCSKKTYMMGAHFRWYRIAKKNGVTRREMYKRIS